MSRFYRNFAKAAKHLKLHKDDDATRYGFFLLL